MLKDLIVMAQNNGFSQETIQELVMRINQYDQDGDTVAWRGALDKLITLGGPES